TGGAAEQLVHLALDRLAHHVLPPAGLLVCLLVRHADDVDKEKLGEAVLAHDGDRLRAPGRRQGKVTVVLQGEQAVPLHPSDCLAHRRAALVQPLRDTGTKSWDPLLLQLEDGPQIHLCRVDQIIHGLAPPRRKCYPLAVTLADMRSTRRPALAVRDALVHATALVVLTGSVTLMDVPTLAGRLVASDPPTVLDFRWSLGGPPGREAYLDGHIPGAAFIDLDAELCGEPGA